MPNHLVHRLRRAADERCVMDPGGIPWPLNRDACTLLEQAADAIEQLTADLAAAIEQRERMEAAIRRAQGDLRALQDVIVAPHQDGL
jgi:hypothetical protein